MPTPAPPDQPPGGSGNAGAGAAGVGVEYPTAGELYALTKVTPQVAIDFFESLGIVPTWAWNADAAETAETAFYISKVMELDVLQAVKDEIARALQLGISQGNFRKFLRGRLAQLGWLGAQSVVGPNGEAATVDISTPWRINTIFRTNVQTALNAGRFDAQYRLGDVTPYWQYLAVLDLRTRLTHRAMSGFVFRYDDPIWNRIYPPCGFNCRCRVRTMTEGQFKRSGAELSDGSTFVLPNNFPDPGFGQNAGLPGAQQRILSAAANAAAGPPSVAA